MPSTADEWKKHFESLQTDTLIELLAVGDVAHDAIIIEILNARGISNEELSNRELLIQKDQEQEEVEQRRKLDDYEGKEISKILIVTGLITAVAVIMSIGFYSRILDSIFINNLMSVHYISLSIICISVSIPWYVFNFFLMGGELFIYLTSDSEKSYLLRFLARVTPKIAVLLVVLSSFIYDLIVSILVFSISIVFSFVALVVLSVLEDHTNSRPMEFIQINVLSIYYIGITSAVILSGTLLLGLLTYL